MSFYFLYLYLSTFLKPERFTHIGQELSDW